MKSYASVVSPKGPATSGIPANGTESADQIMVKDATPGRTQSTKEGIQQYIEIKGAKVSHLILFKPKTLRSLLTAKYNVSPFDAELPEADDFWPDGLHRRRWYSVREWDKIITERNVHQSEWEGWNGETDEE